MRTKAECPSQSWVRRELGGGHQACLVVVSEPQLLNPRFSPTDPTTKLLGTVDGFRIVEMLRFLLIEYWLHRAVELNTMNPKAACNPRDLAFRVSLL